MDLDTRTILVEIRDRLERIENILLGNGQEGLVREVAKNSEFRRSYSKDRRAYVAAVIAALPGFAGLLLSLLR